MSKRLWIAMTVVLLSGVGGIWLFLKLKPEYTNVFFVLSAQQAVVVRHPDATYSLRLLNLNNTVLVFADRPKRQDGVIRISTFVDRWAAWGLGTSPPNASVIGFVGPDKTPLRMVAILAEPKWADGALQFFLTFVSKPLPGMDKVTSPLTQTVSMDDVSVFVDSVDILTNNELAQTVTDSEGTGY